MTQNKHSVNIWTELMSIRLWEAVSGMVEIEGGEIATRRTEQPMNLYKFDGKSGNLCNFTKLWGDWMIWIFSLIGVEI